MNFILIISNLVERRAIIVTEKRKPTYDLESFKQSNYDVKSSALSGALDVGFTRNDINKVIKNMKRNHFYKSMTSYNNHAIWQDVYHVPYDDYIFYIKFTTDIISEFTLLSFKEK